MTDAESLPPLTIADHPTVWAYLDVTDPLVAWHVYRAEIVSSTEIGPYAISSWTADYLRSLAQSDIRRQWARELAIEALRQQHYAVQPSRLRGFYVFPDRESALAAGRWAPHFRLNRLAELALRPGFNASRHDACWIHERISDDDDQDWMHAYLRGDSWSDAPIWELIVEGRALIYGTDLRHAARSTVEATWPESMTMLEFARLGVEVGVDVGLISATAVDDGDGLEIKYFMNFDAKDGSDFVKRLPILIASGAPMDHAVLRPDAEWVVPDLTDMYLRL